MSKQAGTAQKMPENMDVCCRVMENHNIVGNILHKLFDTRLQERLQYKEIVSFWECERDANSWSVSGTAMRTCTGVFCVSKMFSEHQTRLFDTHLFFVHIFKDMMSSTTLLEQLGLAGTDDWKSNPADWFQIIKNSTRSPLIKQVVNRYVNGMAMRFFGTYCGENEQPVSWTGASCVNANCFYEEHDDYEMHHIALGDHPVRDHPFERVSIPFCAKCGAKYMRGTSVRSDLPYSHILLHPNDLQLNERKLNGIQVPHDYYLPRFAYFTKTWEKGILKLYSDYSDDPTEERNPLILFVLHELFRDFCHDKRYGDAHPLYGSDPDQNFATKVQLEALHVNCVRDEIHPVFSLSRREFAEFKKM